MSVERQLIMSSGGVQQYTISNSLRFRASASAYLSRTPASAGNRKTWTWSGWVKRGVLNATNNFFVAGYGSTPWFIAQFQSDNTIQISPFAGSAAGLITSAVFRDPSAWYHIVIAFDTTQATSTNRIKLYVNGIQQTSFSTSNYPSQNTDYQVNNTVSHILSGYSGEYFDGYLTEVNFIDGQALTPSSFGETSSTTGVWIPKKYTGSYGTNGFYLNFNNNTSTTALGYDTSGNGNNWTPNNFSLTTGSTYDSMIDSPTSYASGANNVGNYCVLNPLSSNSAQPIVNGNLGVQSTSGSYNTFATIGVASGKWYWECSYTTLGPNASSFGISSNGYQPSDISGLKIYINSGDKYNGSTQTSYGASWTANDVIGVALDADSGTLTFYKNNASQGTAFTGLTGTTWYPVIRNDGGATGWVNFGQRPFAYTPPSGYNALNTYNLSTPSIVDGSKQFAASLYTGTGSSLSVSGANFTPDFVWIKSRSAATDHALYDVIRGTQARLESNTTDAEVTSDNGVTAFNSTGFTVGTLAQVNTSSATYVGWQWKANGAGVTNTDGTITSTVSANQTAGFSVVTYTGNGVAGATIGHGLGVAPSMVIFKSRSQSTSWTTYHSSVGVNSYMILNTTDAATSASNWIALSSSVITQNTTGTSVNTNGYTYVAYCFAAIPGYSAFGSYTGNGSTDGPFVYCGFRPRWVMIKVSTIGTAYTSWQIIDTSRAPYNVNTATLWANASYAEGARGNGSTPAGDVNNIDILSNGFKVRAPAYDENNDTGKTYIYAAFAENPFKYSLAR